MNLPMPIHTPDKQTLRHDAKALRDNMSSQRRREASVAIWDKVLRVNEINSAKHISIFAGFGSEVETSGLILELLRRNMGVYLPRVVRLPEGNRDLEFYRVNRFPEDCPPGMFGIPEPDPSRTLRLSNVKMLDVILVPALLFDTLGQRLGQGGGYYDRLLPRLDQTFKIGLAFQSQMVIQLPIDPWDTPVDAVMTEADYYQFKRNYTG